MKGDSMKLSINQHVIFDDGIPVECYVKRINKKTVTLYQRKPKLENGGVRSYRVPLRSLKKYVKEG